VLHVLGFVEDELLTMLKLLVLLKMNCFLDKQSVQLFFSKYVQLVKILMLHVVGFVEDELLF